MNKGIIIAIVAIVLVVGVGLSFTNQQSQQAEQTKMAQEKTATAAKEDAAMKEKEAMMKKSEEVMMMAQQDATSKKAMLTDVSGGKGSGEAFVLRKNGKLYFSAIGNLPDPQSGAFYEGWLVKVGSNPPQFIDTGKLEKQKDGSFEVSYSSDTLYEEYDKVVITWEQVDDQKPEKHILEGIAK